jgi:restriction endonuclease Mrr
VKKNNPVQLDAVRAFWATVDENATKGIIATTSRLTSGSEEYCKARLYRLSAFEGDKIINWIRNMKKR